jgi:hypothetical protein
MERDSKGKFIGGPGYWRGVKGDPRLTGARHWNYRASNSYSSLHKWARKQFAPLVSCWVCGAQPKRLEVACINRVYTREGATWAVLCVRCHRTLDNHPYMRHSMG